MLDTDWKIKFDTELADKRNQNDLLMQQEVYHINTDDEYTDMARLQNQIFDLVRE